MRTLAHISDLHFGREDAAVAEGLIRDLHEHGPDLLIVSGDLTQRARRAQFRAAADFLHRLPAPQIVVPGNHDVPLYDVVRRFASPLGRYRRFITDDLYPEFADRELRVLGISTVRSLTWKSGRISPEQIEAMRRRLCASQDERFKVVVTHHPFIPPPGEEAAGIDLVGDAQAALEVIAACGVDLLLAGHLHHGYTGDVRTYYPSAGRSVIVVQAGTAISHRVRHEPNGYNLITLDENRILIAVRVWRERTFVEGTRTSYRRRGSVWEGETVAQRPAF